MNDKINGRPFCFEDIIIFSNEEIKKVLAVILSQDLCRALKVVYLV